MIAVQLFSLQNSTTTAPSRETTATITPSETTTATSSDTTAASVTNSETTVRVTAVTSRETTATSYETTVTVTPGANSTLTEPPNYCKPSSNNETIVTILYGTPAAGNSFIIGNTGICIDSVLSIVTYAWLDQNSVCICQYAIGNITCFFVKK